LSHSRNPTREDILRQIRKFAEEMGRPPKAHEKGFETVAWAARKEFGSWTHALKVAGLQTYKDWRRKKTFVEKIRRLLNCNPMTLKELRRELSKGQNFECSNPSSRISIAIKQANNIDSIGPRGSYVYFLKGQEKLAQTRLDGILSKIPELEEEIFCRLRQPMTRAQIEKSVSHDKLTRYRKGRIHIYLRELQLAKLIYKARFVVGSGRGHARKYKSFHLFGKLANKTFYCRFDCQNEVAELVLKNIPHEELDNAGARMALVRQLKRIFPEDVFRLIDRELWAVEF